MRSVIWLEPLSGDSAYVECGFDIGDADAGWAWVPGVSAVGVAATLFSGDGGSGFSYGPPLSTEAPPLRLTQRFDGHGVGERHSRLGKWDTAGTPDRSPRLFGQHGDNAYR